MGTDRTVIDSVDAHEVEPQDYVRFMDDGSVREGCVLDVLDGGESVVLVLSDDDEGDTVEYEVSAFLPVSLLAYEVLEVA